MRDDHTEHPLGTPGLSARAMARSAKPDRPAVRFLSSLFPGLRGPWSTWQKGADGEEAAARRLAKLSRDEWMVLHDRPLGSRGRNVDHLVIGPGGVFSINTKNLSGKVVVRRNAFLVNGFPERYLHASRDEAARVGERLSVVTGERVAVDAIIVVLAAEIHVESQPEGVHVLDVREVPRWFEARPRVLDQRRANRIYEATRKGQTWRAEVSSLRRQHTGLTTSAWKRSGHERVYVNDAGGTGLGYLDQKTGVVHLRDAARGDEVRAALAPYLKEAR